MESRNGEGVRRFARGLALAAGIAAGCATDPDRAGRAAIHLGYVAGISERFTEAEGSALLDLDTGEMTVETRGLRAPPDGAAYEVWIVDHPGAGNDVSIDPAVDRILPMGTLDSGGALHAHAARDALGSFSVDMVAVVAVPSRDGPPPSGAPTPVAIAGFLNVASKMRRSAESSTGGSSGTAYLEKRGRKLFFKERFRGNGRTCGTCHREEVALAITPAFIAALAASSPTDPLFVSQNPQTGASNPDLPPGLFEDPPRLLAFGLILENQRGIDEVCGFPGTDDGNAATTCLDPADVVCDVDGCEHPQSKSVRRVTPTAFNTRLSAPFGFGGDVPDLQAFALGAVFQHFPKTLNREAGVDFRLPTIEELEAMEAFMQSRLLPDAVADPGFDPFALAVTAQEQRGAALFRAGVGGLPAIGGSAGKCTFCHQGPTLGNTFNADTGVDDLAFSQDLPPDPGPFNVLPTVAALGATPPFFHNGAAATLRDSVAFYTGAEFAASPAGLFLAAFTGGPIVLDAEDVDDVTAFLEAL